MVLIALSLFIKEEEVLSWMQERFLPKVAVYKRHKADDSLTTMACRLLLPKKEPVEPDEKTLLLKRRSRWLLPRLRKGDWSMLDDLEGFEDDEAFKIDPPVKKPWSD